MPWLDPEGLWLPCCPVWPCGDDGLPDGLEEDDGWDDEEPPLLEGDGIGGGMPPDELGEPVLPLGGELGTGMLGGLGWVITVCDRQPDTTTAPRAAIVARNWLWFRMSASPSLRRKANQSPNRSRSLLDI